MTNKCPKCHSDNPDTQQFCGECGTQIISSDEIPASPTKTLETPTEELTTGSTFAGRYQIVAELGRGGMGKVYRVVDTKLNEEVALKLLKPEIASDKKTIERFSSELKMSRKIAHRNVCKMYDLGEEKGIHYITMEYVPGEDLKRLIIKVGQLSAGKTISIAKQICEGLAEAHRLGTVHRDLKPQNIMVDEEGNARIMDFGIARSVTGKGITGAGVMIGTPEYMSPEQAEVKEVDQRSDIYSLGVILYEMVTGRVPFEGETPLGIAMKHKSEKPKDPRELNTQIPEDLSRVILKCLEKDKDQRYQSAGEVRSELENIEKGIPTTERVIPKRKPITSKEITVTFGLKKLFIPALVVIVLVVATLIILKLIPQREAVISPKIENSIAVISFENQTGDDAYDYLQKVIPNLLITNLENTGLIHVVTWERMHDLLKQIGKNDVETIDRDLGFEVCRLEGIRAIVLGFFTKAGDVFNTDIKVLDTETKKILKSYISKGDGVESILKTQIDELSREISQGIGISREKIEASKLRITDVTTTSIDAYNYFLRGLEAREKYYREEARQLLEKAIELDPIFATAHLYLAQTYSLLRNIKARNQTLEEAKTYSKKTSEKERLYIEADYANLIERNPEKRFSILSQIAKKYPREKRVHLYLGNYYGRSNQHKAIQEFNRALELDPYYGLALNGLGYIYGGLEDYEKAIEYFKKYASLFPRDANPLDSWAETYFKMGRLEDAIAKYKEALIVKPDYYNTYWKIGYIYALKENYPQAMNWINQDISIAPTLSAKADGGYIWKGIYYAWLGRLDQALPELKRAIEIWKDVEDKDWESVTERIIGWIYYDRGELESCRRYFKSGFDTIIKNRPESISLYTAYKSFYFGLVELKEGRIDSAKTRLSEMKSLLPKINPANEYAPFYYDLLNGEVLLAEGSIDKAIAICENARTLGTPAISYSVRTIMHSIPFLNDVLARAYYQKGELDNAIAEYERLITFDPNSKERRLIHPKLHYRLAKLYEEKGWKGKAIEHYEKFLDLMKNADPSIAEVEDAKKRLAGLKSQ